MAGLAAFSLSEVEEGSEPDEFWKVIGGKRFYCSLAHGKSADNKRSYRKVPLNSFHWNGCTLLNSFYLNGHTRVSFRLVNSTARKYHSIAFIRLVTYLSFIHRAKNSST